MKLFCSWTALKNIKINKSLDLYYYDSNYYYEVLTIDTDTVWYTKIWKNHSGCKGLVYEQNDEDLIDFEDNFKSTAQLL